MEEGGGLGSKQTAPCPPFPPPPKRGEAGFVYRRCPRVQRGGTEGGREGRAEGEGGRGDGDCIGTPTCSNHESRESPFRHSSLPRPWTVALSFHLPVYAVWSLNVYLTFFLGLAAIVAHG